ncbi:MAG: sporulation transcription factor Spo0A [Candidatus Ornithomonoglobus sp.]
MKNKISVLVVDDDEKYVKELVSYMKTCGDFMDAEYALDGEEGLEMALITRPDAIVLDAVMPRLDGIGFLRKLNAAKPERMPVIVMNSASQMSSMLNTAIHYGVNYFMVKPQSCSDICDTIFDLLSSDKEARLSEHKKQEEMSLEENVTSFLRCLGMPAHLSGYRYIRSALIRTTNDISLLNPITQKLYPVIAKEFNTSDSCVERAMRHAIEVSWKRGNKKLLNDIFGYGPDTSGTRHPTNSEYIAMAADDFRLRMKYGKK